MHKPGHPSVFRSLWHLALPTLALAAATSAAFAQDASTPKMITKQSDVIAMFARAGDSEAIDTMIRRGADVDVLDSDGNSPLEEALENNHFPLALDLINRGALADIANRASSAMMLAIMRSRVDVVQALIDHGMPVDKDNLPAVENAAGVGNLLLVKLLITRGASVNRRDVLGGNAVIAAVKSGKVNVLECVLAHDADPNVGEKDGETPLTEAMLRGETEMIPILLAHGADVRRTDGEGFTALDLAADGWHPRTYPRLKAAWMKFPIGKRHRMGPCAGRTVPARPFAGESKNEALLRLSSNGDAEGVRILLGRGANPSARAIDGDTPLYVAVRGGSAAVVAALLDHGANTEEREPLAESALCHAVDWGENEIASTLIAHGASVDPEDVPAPPLVSAAKIGNEDLVKLLLGHGASVDARDINGATALWYAADLDDPSIARLLLAHGASAVSGDLMNGDTPLIRAARHGRQEIVSMLLAHGADPSAANFAGQSALKVADDGYHLATLAMLRAGPGTGIAKADGAGPLFMKS